MAIFQARFTRYLEHRGLVKPSDQKVWAFLGDGEMDEPESMGALTMPVRERLDNLIFVINCNLQRLDGPVRGNGKIIQELEAAFLGAGWNVIKVLWGSRWDPLLARDNQGLLRRVMEESVDGEYQNFKAKGGAYTREHFFGKYPELKAMVANMSDEEIWRLNRGGHDPRKVYRRLRRGHGAQGPADRDPRQDRQGLRPGQGRRRTDGRAPAEEALGRGPAHLPRPLQHPGIGRGPRQPAVPQAGRGVRGDALPEGQARARSAAILPVRRRTAPALVIPPLRGVRLRARGHRRARDLDHHGVRAPADRCCSRTRTSASNVVPIVPDEARTFGMEGLFRQIGIYSSVGQLYTPQDAETLMSYREDKKGQMLEEGINEAGSLCSWIAAGTAYSNHGINMVPFYIFYSMFGFQRVGDFIWAAGDIQARGFLLGATAGRTTLAGEGLQHQDGHSQLVATTVPNCVAYDPAYAYELAVIIHDGLRRMFAEQESIFYYITVMNENYAQPAMPSGVEQGILSGGYLLQIGGRGKVRATLLGSGTILRECLAAAKILEDDYGIPADVMSITSFSELRREALECRALEPAAPGRKRARALRAADAARTTRDRWSRRPTTCASCRTRSASGSTAAT